ncbi:transcriptional regulator [Lysinibacillus capsici]|uniref:transcriptional regulator n=1 Tax=Lysinibacillus capsici TaxID=2115968 RepID=UPI000E1FF36D|nr:transcriptional regulator [Lysinibacillus capsici]RDV32990.1 transcriptional regulator [Lysinibacillus capsici]
MKEQLIKAMHRHQIVHMMYIAKSGAITKRRVKIIHIKGGDSFTAFCFTRLAKRTFHINNVLALLPILQRESEVI